MGHEWEAGRFRLFISHVHTCREQAHNLREALELYYIDGFVAHDDIAVNAAWRQEIESALKTMDGMVSLVSPDFHESAYCNQEVGFAMGRGLRVMSLNHVATPPGFLGAFQAMQAIGRADAAVAQDVFDALWKDPPTANEC